MSTEPIIHQEHLCLLGVRLDGTIYGATLSLLQFIGDISIQSYSHTLISLFHTASSSSMLSEENWQFYESSSAKRTFGFSRALDMLVCLVELGSLTVAGVTYERWLWPCLPFHIVFQGSVPGRL